MQLLDIIEDITVPGWTGIVLLVLTLIQVSPIQINPWSWIAQKVGNALNHDVIKKQEEIQKESQEYRKNNDAKIEGIVTMFERREAEDARNRILRFGDEIKSKQIRHSQEYYNQILADMTDYETYCHEHPTFKNERTIATEQIIRDAYKDHLQNNDFL